MTMVDLETKRAWLRAQLALLDELLGGPANPARAKPAEPATEATPAPAPIAAQIQAATQPQVAPQAAPGQPQKKGRPRKPLPEPDPVDVDHMRRQIIARYLIDSGPKTFQQIAAGTTFKAHTLERCLRCTWFEQLNGEYDVTTVGRKENEDSS